MVASVMVEKLGLKVEPHPEPNQLTLIKKWNVVKVNKDALFNFETVLVIKTKFGVKLF